MVVKSECLSSSSGHHSAVVLREQDVPPSFLKRSLNCCWSVAAGTANGIGRMCGGVIVAQIRSIPNAIAEHFLGKEEGGPFSCESVLKSLKREMNLDYIPLINLITVIGPVAEEILFRGIIQDVALNRVIPYVLKKVMPGKETLLQSKIYTVGRIIVTSALFAAVHSINRGVYSDEYVRVQIVSAFINGIIYGAEKESGLGLLGAIATHITLNTQAMSACIYTETS